MRCKSFNIVKICLMIKIKQGNLCIQILFCNLYSRLFLGVKGRIRIQISTCDKRIRIREALKHTDPEPEHCIVDTGIDYRVRVNKQKISMYFTRIRIYTNISSCPDPVFCQLTKNYLRNKILVIFVLANYRTFGKKLSHCSIRRLPIIYSAPQN
jgi:hypothetical protein